MERSFIFDTSGVVFRVMVALGIIHFEQSKAPIRKSFEWFNWVLLLIPINSGMLEQ